MGAASLFLSCSVPNRLNHSNQPNCHVWKWPTAVNWSCSAVLMAVAGCIKFLCVLQHHVLPFLKSGSAGRFPICWRHHVWLFLRIREGTVQTAKRSWREESYDRLNQLSGWCTMYTIPKSVSLPNCLSGSISGNFHAKIQGPFIVTCRPLSLAKQNILAPKQLSHTRYWFCNSFAWSRTNKVWTILCLPELFC
jgi:hypothetical protein